MTHLEREARGLRGRHGRVEEGARVVVLAIARLGDVAPHADDADDALLLESMGCADHRRPVLRADAVAVQTGVDLEVHPSDSAGFARDGGDVLEEARIADAEVDVGRERLRDLGRARP